VERNDQADPDAADVASTVTDRTLEALLKAFNRHDLDQVMSFFADRPILEMPRGPYPWGARAEGREAVRALLATRFEGIPDVNYSEDRHFVCGDRGVSQWLLTGTTRDGQEIRVRGCDLFEFREGKIARKDSYWKIVE
jgi:ketosteroid isomerase-like protein